MTLEKVPARSFVVEPERLESVEAILRKYPAINANEREVVFSFLRKGAMRDRDMLTFNMELADALNAFKRDNGRELSLNMRELFVIWGIVALAIASAIWIGLSGS